MASNDTRSEKKGIGLGLTDSTAKQSLGKSWFFGIGINKYKHFPDLNNAIGDVQAIQNVLEQKYHLDESKTLFNEEATRRNIFRELKNFLEVVGPADKLFVLFSGHGYFNNTKEGFWVPYEAEPEFDDDFLPNFHLKHYLKHIKARHILVVSDSCFSGSLFAEGTHRTYPGPEEGLELKKSRYGICSGRDNEEVWDGPSGGHSPFANSVLEFLQENQKPLVRASLLAEEVLKRTTVAYRQLPRYGQLFNVGDRGGQYIFRLRQLKPNWQLAWEALELKTEDHLRELEAKIVLLEKYIDQYPNAENRAEAFQVGELLEHKRAFFLAKDSFFRLKKFSETNTPFQQEAVKFLQEKYRDAYLQPDEDQETRPSSHSFTDPRNGHTYKTVELNGLIWMAENLNFDVGEGCWFYDNNTENSVSSGRLYTWNAAKKACPMGWRLPTDEEWKKLTRSFGGYYDYETKRNIGDPVKGYAAMITGGSSGFSAKLGGSRDPNGSFSYLGSYGGYWSATEYDNYYAWLYYFNRSYGKLIRYSFKVSIGFSCRCVRDIKS